MPLTPELRAAYEKALYVVFGAPDLVIRIGEPNEILDAVMDEEGADYRRMFGELPSETLRMARR